MESAHRPTRRHHDLDSSSKMGPAEAFHVSPNIRLSMEIAFEALENANMPISKVKGSDMGVFVAAGMDEGYIKLLFADKGWGGLCIFRSSWTPSSHFFFPKLIPDSMEPVLLQVQPVDGSASE
jgi:hypothetical protein